ncbi:MAG: hypothetical protein IJF27_03020 [Oscillospiraceae bacterium]|nr:hypothetical protein [Oscillospiraceae bacterium]
MSLTETETAHQNLGANGTEVFSVCALCAVIYGASPSESSRFAGERAGAQKKPGRINGVP